MKARTLNADSITHNTQIYMKHLHRKVIKNGTLQQATLLLLSFSEWLCDQILSFLQCWPDAIYFAILI